MNDLTVIVLVVFFCLTLVALAAIGQGNRETAGEAVKGIQGIAAKAMDVFARRQPQK